MRHLCAMFAMPLWGTSSTTHWWIPWMFHEAWRDSAGSLQPLGRLLGHGHRFMGSLATASQLDRSCSSLNAGLSWGLMGAHGSLVEGRILPHQGPVAFGHGRSHRMARTCIGMGSPTSPTSDWCWCNFQVRTCQFRSSPTNIKL